MRAVAPGRVAGRALVRAPRALRRTATAAREVPESPQYTTVVVETPAQPKVNGSVAQDAQVALQSLDTFARRHIGPNDGETKDMLRQVKAASMEEFVDSVVPNAIRYMRSLPADSAPMGEQDWLNFFRKLMDQNVEMKQCIGMGYYECKTPPVILRNLLESPGWYTPYTAYQAEISQGRLESLLNFQQMVSDLTGLPVANASLLDEATAVAEGCSLALAVHRLKRKTVFLDKNLHPASIACAKTRMDVLGCKVIIGDASEVDVKDPQLACVAVQYPDTTGSVKDWSALFAACKENKVISCCATDLLAMTVLTPPGELGADIACGSAQRFGVPIGFGGPHAAFFASKQDYVRFMPGRIIGVSKDRNGNTALRIALQTREQHIKRERATSNICTAQALLANISGMFAVYHGPEGLKNIAKAANRTARAYAAGMVSAGHSIVSQNFFDTVHVKLNGMTAEQYRAACEQRGINIRVVDEQHVTVALDETTQDSHLVDLVAAGGVSSTAHQLVAAADDSSSVPPALNRTSKFLEHPVFNSYHCEMEMQRYIYRLQRRDLGLTIAMIPLGSCTMKLNAAAEMLPITWPTVNSLHPFVPPHQVVGYKSMITDLEDRLAKITGMDACSLQPNSGAQGEYTGLRLIAAYHESRGEGHRDVCLIPSSAHGTNPASAVMCGMQVAAVQCDAEGKVSVENLKAQLDKYEGRVSAFMITYPSTFGVFDENIKELTGLVHQAGGQVYIDGANMNAQMGLAFPGEYGGDVLHLNLHKTFAIPHGGGGPGMGPVCFREHLKPFAPSSASPGLDHGSANSFGQISQAAFGSASILPISWAMIRMLDYSGCRRSSEMALLNANYMMSRLADAYPVLYKGERGRCAHEFILDMRPFKKSAGVDVEDIAKRLMDYNFHAPTMSFPVAGTLMIEPTESESKFELDRFVEALLLIRDEIREIEDGNADRTNNVLKNSPHTMDDVISGEWERPYTRQQAAFPTRFVRDNKHWPFVGRIDSVYGDRNFICSCPPMESYSAVSA
eukprot:TRINITY_DN1157_c0_g2_i1.p1 TRINITY_DN1157_c0_g2~~TRINITY_DN1157_c0_g2_i1.p1  ORF type:complete len:1019 (+),score=376.96 TRINITY_DN1157_c0_g2_i1:71-3127(+)